MSRRTSLRPSESDRGRWLEMPRRVAPFVLLLAFTACRSSEPATKPPEKDVAANGPAAAGSGTTRDDDCVQMTRGEFAEIVVLDNLFAPECPILVTDQILRLRHVGVRVHTLTISENQDDMAPFLLDLTIEGGTVLETDRQLREFVDPGVYEFYCKFHSGMDGVMQVVEPVVN
jgi:hypothetical protein